MNTVTTNFSAAAATAVAILCFTLSGCTESHQEPAAKNALLAAPVPDGMVRGTVAETIDSGGYTYAFIESDEYQHWIAGPATAVQVGDVLQASAGMPMTNFTSNTLNRTFDVVYFSSSMQNLSSRAPAVNSSREPVVTDVADVQIAALEPGQDSAYVYANKDELAGQAISLRGKVVKYNKGIMGWNFIHIQDGSGDAENRSNDLTVTSKDVTAVGETVVVTGAIILDRDFGAGYSYTVLMEDATISTE